MMRRFRRQRARQASSPATESIPAPVPDSPHPGSIATLTDENFMTTTTGQYTFVDFGAPWCAPCRHLDPVFKRVAVAYDGRLRFAKCDVDKATQTASLLQIQTIPTVVLFDPEGNEVGRVVNPRPGMFASMVEEVVQQKGL